MISSGDISPDGLVEVFYVHPLNIIHVRRGYDLGMIRLELDLEFLPPDIHLLADNTRVFARTFCDGHVYVYDLITLACIHTVTDKDNWAAVHFSVGTAGTRWLFKQTVETIAVADFTTGDVVRRMPIDRCGDHGVRSISPDGTLVLLHPEPSTFRVVRLDDPYEQVDEFTIQWLQQPPFFPRASAFSPDSTRVAVTNMSGVVVVRDITNPDAPPVKFHATDDPHTNHHIPMVLQWSGDSRRLMHVQAERLTVWSEIPAGTPPNNWRQYDIIVKNVHTARLDHTGSRIAIMTREGELYHHVVSQEESLIAVLHDRSINRLSQADGDRAIRFRVRDFLFTTSTSTSTPTP